MATCQGPPEVEDIRRPQENSVSQPEDTAVEDGEVCKRKRHDSSDEEECVLESDDSQEKDNPAPSINTRIKYLIARKEQTSAADNIDTGGLLGEIAPDLKVKEQTGKAVNDELAAIVDSLLAEKLSDTKLQAKSGSLSAT
ncbi:Hypothetical predicted protein [Paramuricea clavata]|uniref:Uncharacterized protein n=1 Tax=Paramuricea clavata TaxID=317549 RepID=A0A6S7JK63_PARCT|nr:Hypothetical predicted protein [Paramuricea clavata]